MKKRITAAAAAILILLSCGCGQKQEENSEEALDDATLIYERSDGTVVYSFDGSMHEVSDPGKSNKRNEEAAPIAAKDGGISSDEAMQLLDSYDGASFYLGFRTDLFKKYFNGIVEDEGTEYYSFSFYAEKDGKKIFAGTDAFVSIDGKNVLKRDWTGSLRLVEKTGKATSDKADGAEATAIEALLEILDADSEKLGLTEGVENYTFEIESKLTELKSLKWYRFIPKLGYDYEIRLGAPVYVSADGKGNIIFSNGTSEYEIIK